MICKFKALYVYHRSIRCINWYVYTHTKNYVESQVYIWLRKRKIPNISHADEKVENSKSLPTSAVEVWNDTLLHNWVHLNWLAHRSKTRGTIFITWHGPGTCLGIPASNSKAGKSPQSSSSQQRAIHCCVPWSLLSELCSPSFTVQV